MILQWPSYADLVFLGTWAVPDSNYYEAPSSPTWPTGPVPVRWQLRQGTRRRQRTSPASTRRQPASWNTHPPQFSSQLNPPPRSPGCSGGGKRATRRPSTSRITHQTQSSSQWPPSPRSLGCTGGGTRRPLARQYTCAERRPSSTTGHSTTGWSHLPGGKVCQGENS